MIGARGGINDVWCVSGLGFSDGFDFECVPMIKMWLTGKVNRCRKGLKAKISILFVRLDGLRLITNL